ncbi:hypothetical protein BOTNAR_0670g00010 [Botryotinia narcissicola]|uniref:Uncharacterized protein n=1 Tax=Botryotinia narcissicola TaxID=278944 RepID=A0A4Z1H8P7_9HELO|nr:hypothetical protein BOTNAR_0670g00010 [Botryotinia narcissicola]
MVSNQKNIEEEYAVHLKLLKDDPNGRDQDNQQYITPVFPASLKNQIEQHGLIAGHSSILTNSDNRKDPRLFYNIAAPFSTFICGSQGSGKSHTLSCLLEICLAKSSVSKVKKPLSALLFHYDAFIGDVKGTPCEAAYLASDRDIKVRVLCPPTNFRTIQRTYSGIKGVKIQGLCIDETDLTTQRMLSLMAVKTSEEMPLYLQTITRVLRVLRLAHQINGKPFHYGEFKKHLEDLRLTTGQEGPLIQRLDTLESFMPIEQRSAKSSPPLKRGKGTDWSIKVTSFLEILKEKSNIGKVVALEEAQKLKCLRSHVAALHNSGSNSQDDESMRMNVFKEIVTLRVGEALLFAPEAVIHKDCDRISLSPGNESSTTLISGNSNNNVSEKGKEKAIERDDDNDEQTLRKLGTDYVKIKVRARLTSDGGRSVLAA